MRKIAVSALPLIAGAAAAGLIYTNSRKRSRIHEGQVAVITGGSSGLGLALAHRFGRAGLKLVLAARDHGQLKNAQQELLSRKSVLEEKDILLAAGDLSRREEAASLVASALDAFGKIDVLINNAGIIEVGPAEDQPLEAYERAIAINFFAAVYATYSALPRMLARRSGAIVNISSIGGKVAVPHLLAYTASKFALAGFSEGLHAELRSKGIRVTTVCPGLMRTGGEDHARFFGQAGKEQLWFKTAAKTPIVAASASRAADKIFAAVDAGRAELTITPQAWLAARFAGLAPEATQKISSLVNALILPDPLKVEKAA